MFGKKPGQMACSHTKPLGELIDAAAVKRSALDIGERPFDRRFGALPRRTEGSRFRPASETRSKACALCRRGAAIEFHIVWERCSRRAHRTTIDAGRLDGDKHEPVPCGVATSEGFVLSGEVEHLAIMAIVASYYELDVVTTSENDRSTDAVIAPDLFEMQRRMPGIAFQQGEILVRQDSDALGQAIIDGPEFRAGEMSHSARVRPAR